MNPQNFSVPWKVFITSLVAMIGMSVVATAGIDAVGNPQYSKEFGVSTTVGSLASGKSQKRR